MSDRPRGRSTKKTFRPFSRGDEATRTCRGATMRHSSGTPKEAFHAAHSKCSGHMSWLCQPSMTAFVKALRTHRRGSLSISNGEADTRKHNMRRSVSNMSMFPYVMSFSLPLVSSCLREMSCVSCPDDRHHSPFHHPSSNIPAPSRMWSTDIGLNASRGI